MTELDYVSYLSTDEVLLVRGTYKLKNLCTLHYISLPIQYVATQHNTIQTTLSLCLPICVLFFPYLEHVALICFKKETRDVIHDTVLNNIYRNRK